MIRNETNVDDLIGKNMIYKKTCERCGRQFTAQKSNTRFCSKQCADAANKERLRKWTQSINQKHDDLMAKASFQEVMTPRVLAEYLGVSRMTAYRYIENGLLPAIRMPGKTLVRKSDVDKLFDNAPPYKKKRILHEGKAEPSSPSGETESSGGYTTVKEVAEKHGLSPAGADKLLKESGITVVKHRGKHYYPLSEVEALFRRREAASHPEISEWYTGAEVQEKYGLKPASVWDLVSKYRIPSKKVHNVTYYSKVHIDLVRGGQTEDTVWYTVEQAMEKYSQTRDQVYNVLRYNHIERVQTGKYVKFRRRDYDECMKYTVKPDNITK